MKHIVRTSLMTAAAVMLATGALAQNYSASSNMSASYSTVEPSSGTPATMDTKWDASAGQVRNLQQSLNNRGYGTGSIDGVMGRRTAAALRKFQADNNLAMTGTATNETLEKLGLNYQNGLGNQGSDINRNNDTDDNTDLNSDINYDNAPM